MRAVLLLATVLLAACNRPPLPKTDDVTKAQDHAPVQVQGTTGEKQGSGEMKR